MPPQLPATGVLRIIPPPAPPPPRPLPPNTIPSPLYQPGPPTPIPFAGSQQRGGGYRLPPGPIMGPLGPPPSRAPRHGLFLEAQATEEEIVFNLALAALTLGYSGGYTLFRLPGVIARSESRLALSELLAMNAGLGIKEGLVKTSGLGLGSFFVLPESLGGRMPSEAFGISEREFERRGLTLKTLLVDYPLRGVRSAGQLFPALADLLNEQERTERLDRALRQLGIRDVVINSAKPVGTTQKPPVGDP